MTTNITPQRTFLGASALLFAASAAVTIVWCSSMSGMGEMVMPGGWAMSSAWMRMPGQTWSGVAASFIGMWVVMMVAMMLPSLAARLWNYRPAVGRNANSRLLRRVPPLAAGYFCVWAALGSAVFPLGAALVTIEMQIPAVARAVPLVSGIVLMIAGAFQFTAWKAHHLECCRNVPGHDLAFPIGAATAWGQGIRLGLHCSACCANLTTILLIAGVMDLRAMAAVTVAITAERLAPGGRRVARAIGVIVIAAGLFLAARAIVVA